MSGDAVLYKVAGTVVQVMPTLVNLVAELVTLNVTLLRIAEAVESIDETLGAP